MPSMHANRRASVTRKTKLGKFRKHYAVVFLAITIPVLWAYWTIVMDFLEATDYNWKSRLYAFVSVSMISVLVLLMWWLMNKFGIIEKPLTYTGKTWIRNLSERFDELDKVFDLLLLLLSIITAALFQAHCTMEPLRIAANNVTASELSEITQFEIIRGFRLDFMPLVFLIMCWVPSRIFLKERFPLRKNVSEFCYLFAFSISTHLVSLFFSVSFYPRSLSHSELIVSPMLLIMLLFSMGIVYHYEIPSIDRRTIRTRKEAFQKLWLPLSVRTLGMFTLTLALTEVIVAISVAEI